MVVEPDVIVRSEIAEFLRDCGYKVIEGVTASDVWAIINAKVPLIVVFSEVHLPSDADGFTLASRLRQTHSDVDVMLCTGVSGAAEKVEDWCEDGPVKSPTEPSMSLHVFIGCCKVAARRHGSTSSPAART